MYTTIEPRLIALLNDTPPNSAEAYPRVDLPPLQNANILKTSDRPQALEPNTTTQGTSHSNASVRKSALSELENSNIGNGTRFEDGSQGPTLQSVSVRQLGATPPQSLRKILDDEPGGIQKYATRKRHRIGSSKDEFVQLPQPPKKQRASKHVVPPIIIGLFDPPKNAAMFPPIEPSLFHDSRGRNSLNVEPFQEHSEECFNKTQRDVSSQARGKSVGEMKPRGRVRRKWTEEETQQMLLGVQKHGIGAWTKILQDSDFKFVNRKAVDLKDRFRTCCPMESRGEMPSASVEEGICQGAISQSISRSLSMVQESSEIVDCVASDTSSVQDKDLSISNERKTKRRAHRMKWEELKELGIYKPFKKSKRRQRRPFSEEEDRSILFGFNVYGPAWSLIQKDPRFGLESRRPTDLRDRLRNRYPEKFVDTIRKDVKDLNGSLKEVVERSTLIPASEAPPNQDRSLLVPNQIPSHTKPTAKLPNLYNNTAYGVKDQFSELLNGPPISSEAADAFVFPQSFDWVDNIAPFTSNMGEMDISRLLLDETWAPNPTSNGKQKQMTSDVNNASLVVSSMTQIISE